MEAQTALVGTDGAVELDPVAAVDANFSCVVYPRNTEHDDTLGFDDPFEDRVLLQLGHRIDDRLECVENFRNCLQKFAFVTVSGLDLCQNILNVRVSHKITPH